MKERAEQRLIDTKHNESSWGPWQERAPAAGVPFIMKMRPHDRERPAVNENFWRITGVINRPAGAELQMDLVVAGYWNPGYAWLMAESPRFRPFLGAARSPVVHAAPEGCVCSRCNSKNPYAAPNRQNGKYVCFECR